MTIAVTTNGDKRRRRLRPAAPVVVLGWGIALAVAAVAVWSPGNSGDPAAGRPLPTRALAAESPGSTLPQPAPPTEGRQRVNLVARDAAPPRRITIPAIGVSAPVVSLGREPDGTMRTPREWQSTGWYKPGAEPGERGPAVIVGHVDSTSGPAAFYRLRELHRGNVISIRRADHTTVRFRVEGLERWPKSEFPTQRVFGPRSTLSVLRLVTCSGNFDSSTGHYVDNTIVYAVRVPAYRNLAARAG